MKKTSPFVIIIAAALAFRDLLRDAGQYESADKIRKAVELFGYKVEDKK